MLAVCLAVTLFVIAALAALRGLTHHKGPTNGIWRPVRFEPRRVVAESRPDRLGQGATIVSENSVMENVAFEYRLVEGGWAEVDFRVARQSTTLAVSHADEPLDHLIAAALAVAAGLDRVEVCWQAHDDGRQWWDRIVWELDHVSEDLHVRVTKLRRGAGGQQGGTQLTGACSVLALCSALAEGTNQLYLRSGLRGYRDAARHPFPVDGLDRLEAVTSNSPI